MKMSERKKQARFKTNDDVRLLREVVSINPYQNKGKWPEVGENLTTVNFRIDGRRARERTQLLLNTFRKDRSSNLKKSGIDEEYSEKEELLEELDGLIDEEEKRKESEKEKAVAIERASQDVRKRALENMTPKKEQEDEPKPKKAGRSDSLLDFLQSKRETELEAKKEEMERKREELKLKREEFELEKEERKQKLEIERQEKMMMFELLKNLTKKQ